MPITSATGSQDAEQAHGERSAIHSSEGPFFDADEYSRRKDVAVRCRKPQAASGSSFSVCVNS